MTFDVAAESYDRFMGRWSQPLAVELLEVVRPEQGQRVLDVGCGPGALTGPLVERLGADAISAVDPSESFVETVRQRFPGVDVRRGTAERLPYGDGEFDHALAQLVVHFMRQPVAGLREMGRVTRPEGTVAASVWDHTGDEGPLSLFWRAVRQVEPGHEGESALPGTRPGHLAELFWAAGLREVETSVLRVTLTFGSFDDWWLPFTLGVGPAGSYVTSLAGDRLDRIRDACRELLPPAPFELTSAAWCVTGRP